MSFSDLTLVKYKDRVRDFTRTSGTSAIVLEGEPPLGYSGFDVLADADRIHYCIVDTNGDWAVYRGDFSASASSISKIQLLASSSGSDISFSAERKEVFLVSAGITYEDLIAYVATLATGIPTPVAIANGGTSATSASGARSALGLDIGVNVETWNAALDSFASATGFGILAKITASQVTVNTLVGTDGVGVGNGSATGGNPYVALAINGLLAATTSATSSDLFAVYKGDITQHRYLTWAQVVGIGTLVQAWDGDLDALAAATTFGLVTRLAASSYAQRTITAASGMQVVNGDGVAAAPSFGLAINALVQDAAPDSAADWLVSWDTSASTHAKILPSAIQTGLLAGSQAQAKAGTSATVAMTPAIAKHNPGSAKAFGRVTVSATVATLVHAYNIASATMIATGRLLVSLTTPFSSASFGTPWCQLNDTSATKLQSAVTAISASQFECQAFSSAGTLTNPVGWVFGAFGDFA